MNKKTILIAEDDALLRAALYEKLTREGFTVRIARDGEECVEEAFESYPDLILLDILMPNMSGLAVLKRLRADPWGKTVKVIFLTNTTDAQHAVEEDPYLADGYLIKSNTRIRDVVTNIREQLNVSLLVNRTLDTEPDNLPEYRCTCGKLLFKGVLLFSTIEIKCKRCGEVRRIDNTDQEMLG